MASVRESCGRVDVITPGEIPEIGFGVYGLNTGQETRKAVLKALSLGYRLIDTASIYFNECDVGWAVRNSRVNREEIFVTSKLWMQDYGYTEAKKGINRSLKNLNLDYIDLYLLHQPYGDVLGAWKTLEEAVTEGKIRMIGVSNFTQRQLEKFLKQIKGAIKPVVNQVECNPLFQQKELSEYMSNQGIKLMTWRPLGHGESEFMDNQCLIELSHKYQVTVPQLALRWHVQRGNIPIPKTKSRDRMKENIDIFNFHISSDDMKLLEEVDTGKGTWDPESEECRRILEKLDVHRNEQEKFING